ncbi:hypothetical protein NL676_015919 [Syzygium grande]|nr:hypothetical protein NL676_015919 [Syzygium grande]
MRARSNETESEGAPSATAASTLSPFFSHQASCGGRRRNAGLGGGVVVGVAALRLGMEFEVAMFGRVEPRPSFGPKVAKPSLGWRLCLARRLARWWSRRHCLCQTPKRHKECREGVGFAGKGRSESGKLNQVDLYPLEASHSEFEDVLITIDSTIG